MAKLNTNVHVADADGTYHVFGPADDLPEWAVKAIDNPKVWADEPEPEKSKPAAVRGKKA